MIPSALLAVVLAVSASVGHAKPLSDDQKRRLIQEFVAKADKEYQAAIDKSRGMSVAELTPTLTRAKKIFDDGSKTFLHNPPYQNWELDFVKDSTNHELEQLAGLVSDVRKDYKTNASPDAIQSHIDKRMATIQTQAVALEQKYTLRAQTEGVTRPTATPNTDADGNESAEDQWENHSNEFQNSEVVKLQRHTLTELNRPSGGGGVAPTNPGGGTTPNGAGDAGGSNGGGSANSGAGGSNSYGDAIRGAAAQAMTASGAEALDAGRYGEAASSAQGALALKPGDQGALMVLHSAQGRVEGGAVGSETAKAAEGMRGFAGAPSGDSGGFGGGRASFGGFVGGGASLGASSPAAARSAAGAAALKEANGALLLGDASAALAAANRGLAQNPNDPALLNLRATIHAKGGDYARAIADAKAGLLAAPHNATLLRTLAFAQVRSKDNRGAIASANELIEMNPQDALAYALRAHAEGAMGDRDAMMADLRRAAALDPRYQAQLAQVQVPSNSDILFLFPGEAAPGAKAAAATPGGRAGKFGAMAGAAALGGLLIGLGLLRLVMDPIREQVSSVFTKMTRTGPTVGAVEGDAIEPASVQGLVPGLIRGQYEIVRQIGAGGMGMVFEGLDKSLGRRVAIKKMREELRVNPQERARFVIEAKTVAALKHPGIVDIYAIADDGADVFLVFEYVDGKTVHELVQHAGRMQPAEASRVIGAASDALAFAHGKGVIHRDMKPSNVMLDAQGRVKVMDFGIARMAKDALTRYSMTNTVVGTPPYMAPEQEQGQVRRESDCYALAVCAYEMLTGKLPFAGIGAGMLMNKINMSFIPPARAIAGLPESLDEVFQKALQADPEKRYRTPREFAAALDGALGVESAAG